MKKKFRMNVKNVAILMAVVCMEDFYNKKRTERERDSVEVEKCFAEMSPNFKSMSHWACIFKNSY